MELKIPKKIHAEDGFPKNYKRKSDYSREARSTIFSLTGGIKPRTYCMNLTYIVHLPEYVQRNIL